MPTCPAAPTRLRRGCAPLGSANARAAWLSGPTVPQVARLSQTPGAARTFNGNASLGKGAAAHGVAHAARQPDVTPWQVYMHVRASDLRAVGADARDGRRGMGEPCKPSELVATELRRRFLSARGSASARKARRRPAAATAAAAPHRERAERPEWAAPAAAAAAETARGNRREGRGEARVAPAGDATARPRVASRDRMGWKREGEPSEAVGGDSSATTEPSEGVDDTELAAWLEGSGRAAAEQRLGARLRGAVALGGYPIATPARGRLKIEIRYR